MKKKNLKNDGPDPVDIHVGARLKLRRKIAGVSQEELATAIGVTFQQIQKYESGANRVSCSRLWRIAKTLTVSPGFFFQGLPLDVELERAGVPDVMLSTESLEVISLFQKLGEHAQGPFIEFLRQATTRD